MNIAVAAATGDDADGATARIRTYLACRPAAAVQHDISIADYGHIRGEPANSADPCQRSIRRCATAAAGKRDRPACVDDNGCIALIAANHGCRIGSGTTNQCHAPGGGDSGGLAAGFRGDGCGILNAAATGETDISCIDGLHAGGAQFQMNIGAIAIVERATAGTALHCDVGIAVNGLVAGLRPNFGVVVLTVCTTGNVDRAGAGETHCLCGGTRALVVELGVILSTATRAGLNIQLPTSRIRNRLGRSIIQNFSVTPGGRRTAGCNLDDAAVVHGNGLGAGLIDDFGKVIGGSSAASGYRNAD